MLGTKCEFCGDMTSSPINPTGTLLVCSKCYNKRISERGRGKKAFTLKDMDEMFSKRPVQKSLMDMFSTPNNKKEAK
jgi:hypothetical protein